MNGFFCEMSYIIIEVNDSASGLWFASISECVEPNPIGNTELREMDLLDLTQSFIERCEREDPLSELAASFQSALEHMGFRYFACCSHVDPQSPPQGAVFIHNYPDAWVRYYCERRLHECDPVFLWAEGTILPFRWDAPEFRAYLTVPQKKIFKDAAALGLVHGYTVPIHLPWMAGALRASCSVVLDSGAISPRAYQAVQLIAMHLYSSASGQGFMLRSDPILSARERECLELAAHGKSDWAISQLLHISQHTVHKHVEAAKRRLGAATRMQAVLCAVKRREISLGDVIRADVGEKRTVARLSRRGNSLGLHVPRSEDRSLLS